MILNYNIYNVKRFKMISLKNTSCRFAWDRLSSLTSLVQSFGLDGVGSIPAIPPTQNTCLVDNFNKVE